MKRVSERQSKISALAAAAPPLAEAPPPAAARVAPQVGTSRTAAAAAGAAAEVVGAMVKRTVAVSQQAHSQYKLASCWHETNPTMAWTSGL